MIEQNPDDKQTVKRLVSLFRDQEMYASAIQILNKFVETNQDDSEAWTELADIYLSKQNYSKALYCYEELLSIQPRNYKVNLTYAEMLYSSQRSDRLEDLVNARKYFSHAAILKQDTSDPCIRALFGLVKTCKAIAKLSKKPDQNNQEILETAQQNIKEEYASKAPKNLQAV